MSSPEKIAIDIIENFNPGDPDELVRRIDEAVTEWYGLQEVKRLKTKYFVIGVISGIGFVMLLLFLAGR